MRDLISYVKKETGLDEVLLKGAVKTDGGHSVIWLCWRKVAHNEPGRISRLFPWDCALWSVESALPLLEV